MKVGAENLSRTAGPAIIADNIDVSAIPSRILGSLEPNGSGKSTLLGMLARTIQPRTDVVRLDDRLYGDQAPRDIARVLPVVQQKATTDQGVTVHDVIDLGRILHHRRWAGSSPRDREIVEAAVRRTGIEHLLNHDWHTLFRGKQQRAHPARTSTQERQVVLLDGPTNHLGISHQLDILKTLRETGLGVVVALHDLNLTTMFCDEVLVLHKGRVVCPGHPADVLTEDLICRVYGVEVRILHPDGNETSLFQFLRPATQA